MSKETNGTQSEHWDPKGTMVLKRSKWEQKGANGPKRTQKDPKRFKRTKKDQKDQKGPKRTQKDPIGPKRTQKDPKGPKRYPKVSKGTKRNLKGNKWEQNTKVSYLVKKKYFAKMSFEVPTIDLSLQVIGQKITGLVDWPQIFTSIERWFIIEVWRRIYFIKAQETP